MTVGSATAVLVCVLACSAATAADWAQWRGPNSAGVTPDASGWAPGTQPQRLWSKNVGSGSSSPLIVGGKVYTMGFQNGSDTVYCFDVKTGEELWKQSYPSKERTRNHNADEGGYSGVLSSPSFDVATGYLYTMGCDGDLKCWDAAKKGALVWGKNLFTDLGVKPRDGHDYGFTACPLVLGEVVLCESTAPGGTVTAFDKKTGVKRWSSAYNGPAGHTGGAAVMTIGGANYLAYLTLHNVVVMGADKGNTVGTNAWSTAFEANIPSPGVLGSLVFITSDYGNKLKCFEVTASGLQEKWTSPAAAKVASPVAYKDSVFVIDGDLKCVDITSGKVRWQGGSFGGGSSGSCVVAAGDNKVIGFGGGNLVLLDASDTKYNELARVDGVVLGTCYPQVALSDGIICCKDSKGQVTCLGKGQR